MMSVYNVGIRRTRHIMCFAKRTCFSFCRFDADAAR